MGDDAGGDVAEFDVAVLRGPAEDLEGALGGAALLAHDDAEGLVDEGAWAEGDLEVLAELYVAGDLEGDAEGTGGVSGADGGLVAHCGREAAGVGGVEVHDAGGALAGRGQRQDEHAVDAVSLGAGGKTPEPPLAANAVDVVRLTSAQGLDLVGAGDGQHPAGQRGRQSLSRGA
ncbi:hypothetical protein [Streptomyces sp. NPDC017940]|uniref:hypothetical protein n=1 Tax=Streptomyces sp. NPDC017940 TaxID=3365017 RepID=UPI0037BBB08D